MVKGSGPEADFDSSGPENPGLRSDLEILAEDAGATTERLGGCRSLLEALQTADPETARTLIQERIDDLGDSRPVQAVRAAFGMHPDAPGTTPTARFRALSGIVHVSESSIRKTDLLVGLDALYRALRPVPIDAISPDLVSYQRRYTFREDRLIAADDSAVFRSPTGAPFQLRLPESPNSLSDPQAVSQHSTIVRKKVQRFRFKVPYIAVPAHPPGEAVEVRWHYSDYRRPGGDEVHRRRDPYLQCTLPAIGLSPHIRVEVAFDATYVPKSVWACSVADEDGAVVDARRLEVEYQYLVTYEADATGGLTTHLFWKWPR